jgi:hypothetical protein
MQTQHWLRAWGARLSSASGSFVRRQDVSNYSEHFVWANMYQK